MGDTDGNEGLSLSEFVDAVKLHEGGASRRAAVGGADGDAPAKPADADAGSAGGSSSAELAAAFASADRDGSGSLDFDEFLELVAANPQLVASFEDILAAGCQRRRNENEQRTSVIFRHAVSPTSHGVVSPSGRRRRPSLFDLKKVDQVISARQAVLPFASEGEHEAAS